MAAIENTAKCSIISLMSVDTTPYEQFLPLDKQYDSKLPSVIDQLDELHDISVAEDNQPYSLDFEANERFKRTFLIGRVLANRSIHARPVIVADRELVNAYYTGLMYSLQAVRLIQTNPIDRVGVRSVTRSNRGVEGSLQDYESSRPNISEYAREKAELIAEREDMTVAVGDAAILGFLLYERADGKRYMANALDSMFNQD